MMVGDDDIDAQRGSVAHHFIGANAGIHADDEFDRRRPRRLHDFAAHAVAVAQTVRNVKGCLPAREFDALFQDHDGAGAIHVVIAVKQDALAVFDGPAQTGDSVVHLGEQPRIVQIGQRGFEKPASLLRLSESPGP